VFVSLKKYTNEPNLFITFYYFLTIGIFVFLECFSNRKWNGSHKIKSYWTTRTVSSLLLQLSFCMLLAQSWVCLSTPATR